MRLSFGDDKDTKLSLLCQPMSLLNKLLEKLLDDQFKEIVDKSKAPARHESIPPHICEECGVESKTLFLVDNLYIYCEPCATAVKRRERFKNEDKEWNES